MSRIFNSGVKTAGDFLALLSLVFLSVTTAKAETISILTSHIIQPSSSKILHNKVIVVENGIIKAIKNKSENIEADKVIDLTGKWLSPGLIDAHVHLTANSPFRASNWHELYLNEGDGYRAIRGAHNAKLLLEGGFTTVKEIGNDGNFIGADIKKAIANKLIVGPRIIYAGKILSPFGGQTHGLRPDMSQLRTVDYFEADSKAEMRKAIRTNIYFGADTIKIVTGDQAYFYNEEDIKFIVDEAKAAGKTVTAHAFGGTPAKNAINAGVVGIEHGFDLNRKLLKLMKKKGVILVGTDFSYENLFAYGWSAESTKKFHEKIIKRLQMAHEVGVKMAFGSDIVINLEGKNRLQSNLSVLKTWQQAKIPNMQVLQAMTINAAELLGKSDIIGSIEVGKQADIVAFAANPLNDINNLSSTVFVMQAGQVIVNEDNN